MVETGPRGKGRKEPPTEFKARPQREEKTPTTEDGVSGEGGQQ